MAPGGNRKRMRTILVLDACVRKEKSRTRQLMDCAVRAWKEKYPEDCLKLLELGEMDLKYHTTASLEERDTLLAQGRLDHPRFDLAHEFAGADGMIVAAPFWDCSIPAVLKVYIENISTDGITFGCNAQGMYGKCRAEFMLYLTTRGSTCAGTGMDQGGPYLESLCRMFGIDAFSMVYADGLDEEGADVEARMARAQEEIKRFVKEF